MTGGCPLAGTVLEADLAAGAVFPALERIRDVSHAVACAVIRRAALEGHAEPAILDDLEDTVRRSMWHPDYLPVRYEPEDGTAGDSRRWAER